MRTTITLDPDVERLLKDAMHQRDTSLKQVVNDALRVALQPTKRAPAQRYVPPVFDSGRPLVDLIKANALAGELEDLDILSRAPAPVPAQAEGGRRVDPA